MFEWWKLYEKYTKYEELRDCFYEVMQSEGEKLLYNFIFCKIPNFVNNKISHVFKMFDEEIHTWRRKMCNIQTKRKFSPLKLVVPRYTFYVNFLMINKALCLWLLKLMRSSSCNFFKNGAFQLMMMVILIHILVVNRFSQLERKHLKVINKLTPRVNCKEN